MKVVGQAHGLRRPLSAKGAFPAPPLNKKNRRIQVARGARFARSLERPRGCNSHGPAWTPAAGLESCPT